MKKSESRESSFDVGGIFKGLGDLVAKLGDLAEKGAELRRETRIAGGPKSELRGVYGFSIRIGGRGDSKLKVEPFGNIKQDAEGDTTVSEEREPIVDVFDEDDHVLVVAELPGAEEATIHVGLEGDVLLLSASGAGRKYVKELLLPEGLDPDAIERSFRNGVLQLTLTRKRGQ
ncbi:MAG: Hsp20 family protein [Candidatus Schekmanbacteria bacterium]|nr:Hsp20 family protein [Candidatus Schekmanbacteria bacterium]